MPRLVFCVMAPGLLTSLQGPFCVFLCFLSFSSQLWSEASVKNPCSISRSCDSKNRTSVSPSVSSSANNGLIPISKGFVDVKNWMRQWLVYYINALKIELVFFLCTPPWDPNVKKTKKWVFFFFSLSSIQDCWLLAHLYHHLFSVKQNP